MTISERIIEMQDVKEMTRRAIKMLDALGQDVSDLKNEFLDKYKEPV